MSTQVDSDVWAALARLYQYGELKQSDCDLPTPSNRDGYMFWLQSLEIGERLHKETQNAYLRLQKADCDAERLHSLAVLLEYCAIPCVLKRGFVEVYLPGQVPMVLTFELSGRLFYLVVNCPGYIDGEYPLTPQGMSAFVRKIRNYLACHLSTPAFRPFQPQARQKHSRKDNA